MTTVLDWHDKAHYGTRSLPCRLCQCSTRLRDDAGRPAHKVCSELESDKEGQP